MFPTGNISGCDRPENVIVGAKKFADVKRTSFGAMAEEAGMRPQLAIDRLDITGQIESLAK